MVWGCLEEGCEEEEVKERRDQIIFVLPFRENLSYGCSANWFVQSYMVFD